MVNFFFFLVGHFCFVLLGFFVVEFSIFFVGFGLGCCCCCCCCFQCWFSKQISLPRSLKIQTDKIYICSPWKLAIIGNLCCSMRKKNNVLAGFGKNKLVKLLAINRSFNQVGLLCIYGCICKVIICMYEVQWLYQGR